LWSTFQKVVGPQIPEVEPRVMEYELPVDVKTLARCFGVSRIANLTGLDRIGFPVAAAIRPLSRNLSVHFGKGATTEMAQLSAVMEAAELFYSEKPHSPLWYGCFDDLSPDTACDPSSLSADLEDEVIRAMPMAWMQGTDLGTGAKRFAPWQTTSMDFTTAARKAKRHLSFGATGLAAGFSEEHAILHGLLEVIERNAHDLWNTLDDEYRSQTRVAVENCCDAGIKRLVDLIRQAGLELFLWNMTDRCDMPCYLAEICDFADHATTPYAQGAACHLDSSIAIQKALAEAMQVRLTYIAGGRDDLDWADYGDRYATIVENRKWLLQQNCANPPSQNPAYAIASTATTLQNLLKKLGPNRPVTVLRLSPVDAPVVVVKTIVEDMADLPDVDYFADQQYFEKAVA
jgi:YcaO-like protein with predicted kinase domain